MNREGAAVMAADESQTSKFTPIPVPAELLQPLIKPGAVLINPTGRKERSARTREVATDYLIRVHLKQGERVFFHRIDEMGQRAQYAKLRDELPVDTVLAEFQTYRACRWDLLCLKQAAVTIPIVDQQPSGPLEACAEHAEPWTTWLDDGRIADMPRPDCWCTDAQEFLGEIAEYCPQHGPWVDRGTSMIMFVNDQHFGFRPYDDEVRRRLRTARGK